MNRRIFVLAPVATAALLVWCVVSTWRRSNKGSGLRARPRPAFVPYIGLDPYWDYPETVTHNATWGNR